MHDIDFATIEDDEGLQTAQKKFDVPENLAKVFAGHNFLPVPEVTKRLAIFGSRTLRDDRVMEIIDHHVLERHAELIVTAAEPAGICAMAQKYAREKKIPLQVHFVRQKKYARAMYAMRSREVINACDCVLFIHDGVSKGTYNEILEAIDHKRPFIYEFLKEFAEEDMFCDV